MMNADLKFAGSFFPELRLRKNLDFTCGTLNSLIAGNLITLNLTNLEFMLEELNQALKLLVAAILSSCPYSGCSLVNVAEHDDEDDDEHDKKIVKTKFFPRRGSEKMSRVAANTI